MDCILKLHLALQTTCLVDQKLRQTVKFMRMNGILKLKTADFELELSPQAMAMRSKREPVTDDDKSDEPDYSQEDILFWSSPGLMLPEDPTNG